MAIAQDYGVTFGYRATDGYYYGVNGIVGKYHRGNDRPCPSGTPIVISGTTIGYTGATGLVSGPHLHTQVCTAGSNYADDFDPAPFEFKNGTVVVAGWHAQFGNRIVIRVGNVDITYAHLSQINVQVGQKIGGSLVIPDTDAYYWRYGQKLAERLRGRQLTREEFRIHLVGKTDLRAIEILSDDPEADRIQEAQNVGVVALRDNWQGQIGTLQGQLSEVRQALANEQAKPPKEVVKEVEKIVEKVVEVPVIVEKNPSWLEATINFIRKVLRIQ